MTTTEHLTDRAIWYTRCPTPTASSVALAGGWLDAALTGSQVQLRSLADSPARDVRQSHFTQAQAAQFRHGGIVPPLWAVSRGAPVTLLGISEVTRWQGVISVPDGRVQSAKDLRGARLGVPRRTKEPVDFWRAHTLRGLTCALAATGIREDEVVWVDLPTDEPYHASGRRPPGAGLWTATEAARLQRPEVLALVRGEVDAIYTYAPTGLGLIELLGATLVVTLPSDAQPRSGAGTLSVLTVGSSVLDEEPDAVILYLSGLLRAADWARQHPADAVRTFAAEEGVPEQWAAATFSLESAPSTPGYLDLHPSLSPALLADLQREADFLLERGFLYSPVDVTSWSDPAPLREASARVADDPDQAVPAPAGRREEHR